MEPRVKNIILNYKSNNLKGVYDYLTQDDMVIDKEIHAWAHQIKILIENNQLETARQIIELVGYKLLKI